EVTLVLHDHALLDDAGHPVAQGADGIWGCDPDLWAVLVDRMGLPLDVGHAKRFATVAQRRAIAVRDQGCAFPGCDQPMSRCDVPHRVWPLRRGRTDAAAMCALCRHPHPITPQPGWSVTANADGSFTWTTPRGRHLSNRAPPHATAA